MLSEKAKGKQRAVELGPATTLPAAEEARDLTIRFTEGIPDLVLRVSAKDTIRDVKKNIADARPQLQDRRLRLIHAGRLLTDGTLLYSWLTTLEERQNRANLGDTNNAGGAAAANSFTTWLHCSVGPIVESGTETEEKLQTAQLQPLRGFDRLSTAGFSQEDIANFRRQFHSHSSSNFLDVDFQSEEEYDEHARALEEQWIDSMDNAGTASLSDSSSSQSLILKGIILGFFFPIIPFFFLRDEPKPAVFWEDGTEQDATESVVFSRRMQIGIMAGFVVNVLFGMWRYLLDTN